MILSVSMMLEWMASTYDDEALADGACIINAAVQNAFASQAVRPREFGGLSGTIDITKAVLERVNATSLSFA